MKQRLFQTGLMAIAIALAACSGEKKGGEGYHSQEATPTVATANPTPAPGGKTIVVEMHTDETGSFFKPNKFEAHKGDVISFKLMTGVHNVHFLPDSNPGKSGLPPASDMLQLPGQTVDIPVAMAKGKYYFQCDPHAALGMVGHVEVED